jgi:large subunit ribosomal protein L21
MFAVIRTGGKQYRVVPDDVIAVEKIAGEAGQQIEFAEVLAFAKEKTTAVGAPLVEGARVAATVLEQARGPKIIVFKKKRRKNHRRKGGHRQDLTVVRIDEVLAPGETPSPRPVKAKEPAAKKAAAKEAKKPGAKKPAAKKPAAKAKKPAAEKPKKAVTKKAAAGKKAPAKKSPAKKTKKDTKEKS